eukprot:UN21405
MPSYGITIGFNNAQSHLHKRIHFNKNLRSDSMVNCPKALSKREATPSDLLQTIDLILNEDRRQKEGMKNQGVGKGVTTMNLDVLDAKK